MKKIPSSLFQNARIFVTTIFFLSITNSLSAQQIPVLEWVEGTAVSNSIIGNSTGTDAAGNSYTIGYLNGLNDLDLGPSSFNITSAGGNDIFIMKMNAAGLFIWAKSIGSTGDDQGYDIDIDAAGNIYLTGKFSGTVDFDPGIGITNLSSAGSFDIFILKLDTDGNFSWVRRIGGTSYDEAKSIKRHPSGGICFTGRFDLTVDFDPGVGVSNLTANGFAGGFMVKLNDNGDFVWAVAMAGRECADVAIDVSGNLYAIGFFSNTTDFDLGVPVVNLVSSFLGGQDVFVTKLDMNGNFVWAKNIVETTAGGVTADHGTAITVDPAGNVFSSVFFSGTADFDPGASSFLLTGTAQSTVGISKIDSNGNFVWAGHFRTSGSGYREGKSITTDVTGNVYIVGSFVGLDDFNPSALNNYYLDGAVASSFIVKLANDGSFMWAMAVAGPNSLANSITIGPSSSLYVMGGFNGTRDFDPSTCNVFNVTGTNSLYMMKLNLGSSLSPTITSLTPISGAIGSTVIITGTNFSATPTNNVVKFFNNKTAVVIASTTTSITATVPTGTITGKISVTTNCITVISTSDFTIGAAALPTITNFTPASGEIGTTVIVTGTNFSTTPSSNIVFFGATKATVTSATTTQLTVTVPAGATYKPITALVNGLQAYSSKPFVVTFAGGGSLNTNSFAPKVDFITGTSPRSVSIGDLDGDGKADMAIASVFSNAISVYRNTSAVGSITFAAKVDFSTGASSNPYCVAIGDLDGDGKQDMAVVNYNTNTLSVLRNTSSGAGTISFATKVDFTTGSFPRFVSIGDLDADGKPDLVVSNAGSNTISIFRNTSASAGTISYAAKADLTGTTGGMSVVINDLDGDGRRDLAVANWVNPGAITTYRNITTVPGSISFAAKVDFPTGHNFLWSIAAGDLDNDGRSDLATPIASVVTLLRNSSTSGSISFGTVVDLVATPYASFVSIDDLNGDGKVDLTVSNDSNGSVSVFENTSSGAGSIGFGANVDFPTGTHPVSNAIADIDGDGRADLVVPNHDANTVSVLRNIMAATLSPTISSFTPNSGPLGTTVTLTGTNFSTTPANNTVAFNGTAATVSASTTTSITVTVPPNATTGKITVTVAGNTATSATDFTVTTGTAINITTQPSSSSVCNNASATFTTAATGTTNITYQWQFATSLTGTYSTISNGSGYVNTTTASLSVNTTGNFGGGFYRCQISGNMATAVFTNSVQLTITTCTSNQPPDIQSTTIEAPVNGTVTLDLAALLSDPDDNLDLSTLKIIVPPLSGAVATIDGQSNLILDYTGISFSGTEKLTIEVCDLSGSCAQNELDIEVAGDIVVYNAVSPNGDGKNDFLFLQHVDLLEETKENHVTILNRWGSVVWEGDNYDNTSVVFSGQTKNGNDLPSGNYFYRIEFSGNYKKRSGFLALKR